MGKNAVETDLFHHHQIIVLLAFLHEDVLSVDEVVGSHHFVEGDLVLVDAHAVTLDHLTGLTLGGEDLRVDGHEIDDGDARFEVGTVDMLLGNAFKDVEEGLFVEFHQGVFGSLSEEDVEASMAASRASWEWTITVTS